MCEARTLIGNRWSEALVFLATFSEVVLSYMSSRSLMPRSIEEEIPALVITFLSTCTLRKNMPRLLSKSMSDSVTKANEA